MRDTLLIIAFILTIVASGWFAATGGAQSPFGRFNIIVEYQDDIGSYDVLTNVTYTLEPDILIINQGGGNKRLIPMYGVEHIRIIRRGDD